MPTVAYGQAAVSDPVETEYRREGYASAKIDRVESMATSSLRCEYASIYPLGAPPASVGGVLLCRGAIAYKASSRWRLTTPQRPGRPPATRSRQ